MKKQTIGRGVCAALLLVLCLLLAACGQASGALSPRAPAEPTPEPTPELLHFSAGDVEPTAQSLKMTLAPGETAMLSSLTALSSADFSGSQNVEEIAAWAAAHPHVAVRYTVTLPNGTVLDNGARSADLKGLSAADCESAAQKLALLPALERVDLGAEGGALSWSDISRLRAILPGPAFQYAFKLYGVDCNLADTKINLYRAQISDDGRLIDEVLGCMSQECYVDMDSCTLDVKRLEEINQNHPKAKVVFRVYFGDNYTARTDCERILASMASRGGMLTNENVSGLYYCHDVKYLDLGHNTFLTDIGFVAQMPKLEVVILSMCNIRDASPLSHCPELEYLEMSNTYCEDLRPFSGLQKLRHLNIASIGYDFYGDGTRPSLKDITPLYSLTQLERLWIGAYNPVPSEQIAEMQRRAPNCEIDTSVYEDPVGGRWRYIALADYIYTYVDTYHERYAKLREQFGDYDYSVYNFTWNDPLCDPNYVPSSPTPAVTPTPAPVYQAQTQTQTQTQTQYDYEQPVYDPYAQNDWQEQEDAGQTEELSGQQEQTNQQQNQQEQQEQQNQQEQQAQEQQNQQEQQAALEQAQQEQSAQEQAALDQMAAIQAQIEAFQSEMQGFNVGNVSIAGE